MPVVTPQLLEAVRQQARIIDLFEASELRRAGKEFVARCPWHDDRRPSLTVSPQRNRVHCFVCNRGSDAIGWLQEQQGLSFQEAVLELARRCGLNAAADDPEAQARFEQQWRERRQLQTQRRQQRAQCHQALLQELEHGGATADYLRARGISAQTARTWQLGGGGGRLLIPLNDCSGQTVAFCGRATGTQQPRYRNSPCDLLFQRNAVVFGLDQAAAAIRREGTALLVEGPLDVIQLHQAGFGNAVACLGTSVSPLQLQLLQRHGLKQLQIAFDGDDAGQAATERLLEQLLPQLLAGGLSASVVQFLQGQDADGLLRKGGKAALEGLIATASHWLEWRLDRLLAPLARAAPQADLDRLQAVEREGRALLQQLPAGVLRRQAELRLQRALNGADPVPLSPVALAVAPAPACTARQRLEQRVVRLFIHAQECRGPLLCLPISDPTCRAGLDWASNLAVAVAEEQLPAALQRVAEQLPGATAALLRQAAAPGAEVLALLRREPQAELQVLLDGLEPQGQS